MFPKCAKKGSQSNHQSLHVLCRAEECWIQTDQDVKLEIIMWQLVYSMHAHWIYMGTMGQLVGGMVVLSSGKCTKWLVV